MRSIVRSTKACVPIFKLPVFLKLINTGPSAAWFAATGYSTLDGTRVVRSVLGAISSLSIVGACGFGIRA